MPSYLHTSIGTRSKYARLGPICTLLFLASSLAISGCSTSQQLLTNKSHSDKTSQSQTNHSLTQPSHSTAQKTPSSTLSDVPHDHLKALLTAEFTLQREGANQAFPMFYQLASETRNKAITERLLRVATATQDKESIEKSADLTMSIAPKEQQAYVLKFQVLMQASRTKETADLMNEAINNRVSLDFLPVYADDNIRSNEIMDTLSTVISDLPPTAQQNPFIQASLARVLFSQGKYIQSTTLSQKLLSDKSTRTPALYLILAYSQSQTGKQKNAITTLKTGLEHYPSSARLLSPLLEFLVQAGELDESNKAYNSAKLQNSERVQAGIHYSNALIASQHPQQALTVLNALPSNRFGLQDQIDYLKATALFDTGQKTDAVDTMNKVNGILTNNATNQIAVWLYEEGKQGEINDILLSRTHKEHLPAIVNAISHLHEEKGNDGLSLDLLTKALALDPQSDSLRYHKAILDDSMGNWQSTIEEMKTLLANEPNNATYLNALGYTLLSRTTKTDEAMKYIEKAYKIEQNDPAITDSLGWGFFLQGKLQQATHYLTKAWELFPDSDIAAHLGESLWAQKKNSQANAIWSKALDGKQSSPLLINTIKRLNPSLINTPNHQEKGNTL